MNELHQQSKKPKALETAEDQKKAACEVVWRRAERDIIRRERIRLFRNGTIRPPGIPQPMVKDASGRWWPNKNFMKEQT